MALEQTISIAETATGMDTKQVHHGRDAAAELLSRKGAEAQEPITISPADDRRVLHKIDWRIVPLVTTIYFLQALDKATLAYSSVFGLIADTGLHGSQYSWLGSVVYIAQLALQFPVGYMLVRLPIGKFISVMVFFWGTTLACMTAAHSFGTLLTARLFLGAFEASVAPTFVALTQMWWRRREQVMRTAAWYSMNGVTNMFGSLMTYGLAHIDSPLKSYQVIFLFFGILTVAFSVVSFFLFPDSPMEAKFLDEQEKIVAVERLRMNQMGVMNREFRRDHVWECAKDFKCFLWFALIFSISIPSGGISTFGPLIVKSFGFDSFQTILFNIPFGAVQFIATVGGALVAMKFHRKGPVIAALCIPPIAGCAILMKFPHEASHKAVLLAGYYLVSVYPAITPLIYSWSSQNTAGDTKRKCSNAILFIGQSAGNIVGPLLYRTDEAPEYHRGLISNMALFCVIMVLVGVTTTYLSYLNKSHRARRVAAGRSAVIIDTSLYSAGEVEKMREKQAAAVAADGQGAAVEAGGAAAGTAAAGSQAFDDLTDLQNDEFIYVY